MYYEKRQLVLTALGAMALGIVLHFLYGWMPNPVTALFGPVNESLWEHVKVLYWPHLLAALWLTRGRPGAVHPWLLTVLLMCGAMLSVGYGYHVLLGGEARWVDLGIYFALMAFGFWFPTRFSGPFGKKWFVPVALTILLGLLIAVFTLWPPRGILFEDLSAVRTWLRLPV